MRYFILFLLFNISITGYAQYEPGYVITTNNDTIFGLLKDQNATKLSRHCSFKTSANGSEIKYLPSQIEGFRFVNGKYYISVEIETNGKAENVFVEWLIKGSANVLAYYPSNSQIRFYIQFEDGTINELINTKKIFINKFGDDYEQQKKEYLGLLNYYFEDAPPVQKKLKNLSLNRNSLISIAEDYHNYVCPDSECIIFMGSKFKPTISLGITGAYNLVDIRSNDYSINIETSKSYSFGLSLNITNLLVFSNRISIQSDLLYSNQQFKYDFDKAKYKPSIEPTLFNLQWLRIPIDLRYQLLVKKFNPFLGGGISFNFIKPTIKAPEYIMSEVINGDWPIDRIFDTFKIGANLQIGVNYTINPKFSFEYYIGYELFNDFFGGAPDNSSRSSNLMNVVSVKYIHQK